ncbi:MAG: TonB-dependent receptor domain-containing protein [Verrucomicrobiota bacterium]
MAQQAAASPAPATEEKADKAVELEKYVVTGSYIPVAADAIAIPVTVISDQEISQTGVTTNALEVLKKAVPQFTGNANIGSNNANIASGSTGGGSQASLRNLTTLTLINGRRVAISPISGTGGNQFVDLNIIPLAAIQSIEVLLDGASATYGSDATSGVVNIKTKSNYNGAEVSGFYEWSDETGNWANRGGNFVVGTGNGKTNVTVAGGWSKQDPLWQFERGFSTPQYGTPTFGGVINFGGNYFVLNPAYSKPPVGSTKPTLSFTGTTLNSIPTAPDGKPYFGAVGSSAYYWGKSSGGSVAGFGAGELAFATSPEAEQVAFNLSNYVTILQRREQRGAVVTFDHEMNDQVQLFGDLLVADTFTFSQINAQPVGTNSSFNVTGAHINNPFNNTVRVRNRFVTTPRQYNYNTNFIRGVIGFRGDISDTISYETAINLNRSDLAYTNPGVIDAAGLLAAAGISPAATSASAINMFQRDINPADVAAANFIGTAYNNFSSALRSWDGRIITRPFSLPAGDVTLVVGSEFRVESLSGSADLKSIPDSAGNIGWTGATSVQPFTAKREVTGFFAEAMVPLASPQQKLPWAHTLELGLAGRHEMYSDTTNPTVPKVTFRWLPVNDEFAVRGTYSESFNAPQLYYLFGPSDVGFTPSVTLLPFGQADNPDNYVGGQAQLKQSNNPGLVPAESKAYTFGMVWSPKAIKGLSLEATYWNIRESNILGVISSQTILQDVEDKGPASEYVAGSANYRGSGYDVRVEGFGSNGDPITAPGQVANNIDSIYLTRPIVNIATQNADGVDFSVNYKWDLPSIGVIGIRSSFAYWIGYDFEGEELGGKATVTGGTIPRWMNYTQFSWNRDNWSVYLGAQYIPAVTAPDEVSTGKTEAEAYAEFNLGVTYRFDSRFGEWLDGLEINLAANNLGSEKPPQLGDTFPNDSVDTGRYDPIGRRFVARLSYKF